MNATETRARENMPSTRVLHVVESLESGTASAVEDYINNTPEIEHVILGSGRTSTFETTRLARIAEVIPLVGGHLARVRQIRSVVAAVRPSVVHAHSTYAGLYVRLGHALNVPIVYTPHCYSFERRDISRLARTIFEVVEGALRARTDCVAAVSPRELKLANRFGSGRPALYVPNVSSTTSLGRRVSNSNARVATAVGRICPQKGPEFFASAAEASRGSGWTWLWVGGGDDRLRARLEASGVRVTGWVPRDEALTMLSEASVYVHTAGWEGAPMSLLEAAGFALPLLCRRTPALEALGVSALFDTPEELAAAVGEVDCPSRYQWHMLASARLAERHTARAQHDALLDVYRRVLGAEAALPRVGQQPERKAS